MNIDIDKIIDPIDTHPSNELITQPYTYLSSIPGNNNNVRTRFIQAFNQLYYHITNQALLSGIGDIISIFHNSSLLIDDIEDSSMYRRGMPAAHTKFGVPLTINCGNLMYFIALQRTQNELPKLAGEEVDGEKLRLEISKILIDEMLNLHHGQGLDIYWRDYLRKMETLPSVEEYLEMVKDKTGGLFRLSIKLLALFSPDRKEGDGDGFDDLIPVANLLGIIYQIRDDYLNLIDTKYSAMKGIAGEDLIEGKLSLPILHCLRTTDSSSPVHKILYEFPTAEERLGQSELIEQCIRYMQTESGSLKYTFGLIKQLETKVKSLILKSNPQPDSLLIHIIDHLCDI
ncbi:BTS1 [[Candida] subhashii]|uniref:BTS1 n=1 Tax=[Candida] subhashii TaxID=561895 RepID=A0A8J5QPS3_9ASCO|nr:BTS1 [[Candida] subhashii]KAG7664178.1 BTS1 [[Candida] subhashii]